MQCCVRHCGNMKILELVLFCALSFGSSYATSNCHDLQQSQLASMNERMTQMLNSFYTSPSSTNAQPPTQQPNSNATPSVYSYEAAYYPYPYGPPVIYVAPPPISYLPPKPQPPPRAYSYYPRLPDYPVPPVPSWSNFDQNPYQAYPAPLPPPSPAPYPAPLPPYTPFPSLPPSPTFPISYPAPPMPYPQPIAPAPAAPTLYPSHSFSYPISYDSYPEYPKPMLPPQPYYAPTVPYPPLYPEIPPPPLY